MIAHFGQSTHCYKCYLTHMLYLLKRADGTFEFYQKVLVRG